MNPLWDIHAVPPLYGLSFTVSMGSFDEEKL